MGFSIDSKCIVCGEEQHLNKLNDFLNSIKDEDGRVEFDKLCDYIPIYDSEWETSDIRANLDNNEIIEIDGETVLQFWVHGWKGDYLYYIKQLIKDKELGLYDKDSEDRSVLSLYYFSYIEGWDYYETNDEDEVFFKGKLWVEVDSNEYFFADEDEAIEFLKNTFTDVDLSELENIDEISEKITVEKDESIYIVPIKTEREIEEEERRKSSWW